jgi:cell division protein FtsB
MPQLGISEVVALAGALIALLTWATSASKSRVDSLCKIIDALTQHVAELEADLTLAEARIADLEAENRCYLRILSREGIDPETYCTPEERDNV